MGPLPESDPGNKYILVTIDHFSKWAEFFAMKNQEAKTIANCLIFVFCRHGGFEQWFSGQLNERNIGSFRRTSDSNDNIPSHLRWSFVKDESDFGEDDRVIRLRTKKTGTFGYLFGICVQYSRTMFNCSKSIMVA